MRQLYGEKKMKKSIVILIGIALILLFAIPSAVAAGTSGVKSPVIATPDGKTFTLDDVYTATVEYTVSSESYTIVIPSQTIFDKKGEVLPSWVNVTAVTLTAGNSLHMWVNSTHGFQMMQHNEGRPTGTTLNYSMSYQPLNSQDFVTFNYDNPGTTPKELFALTAGSIPQDGAHVPIKFEMTEVAPTTGHYTDTLTFTVKFTSSSSSSSGAGA